MEKELIIKCDCGSEAVHINSDNDKEFGYIDLSIWYLGSNNSLGFWERIKYVWRILTKGRPYGDQICLTKETAEKLGKHLIEVSELINEKQKKKYDFSYTEIKKISNGQDGFILKWGIKDFGFGEICFEATEKGIKIHDEDLGTEFVKQALDAMVEKAQIAEE
jgi:hypothetical protein